MYEIQIVECHVIQTFVVLLVEVVCNVIFWRVFCDSPKMLLEPVHEVSFCFTNILFTACVASNTIHNVVAFASYIVFCYVLTLGV